MKCIVLLYHTFPDSSNSDGDSVDIVRKFGVDVEAAGTYLCIARNAVGSASQTVHVHVIGKY